MSSNKLSDANNLGYKTELISLKELTQYLQKEEQNYFDAQEQYN